MQKMKVEIWSDVVCPYCYIGKRKIEAAIRALDLKEEVELDWKSYQLNPSIQYDPNRDTYEYLARLKGESREWAIMVHNQLTEAASILGLEYRFAIAKMTNSFDAHRIIQLAKKHGLGNEMEERLFMAYFTQGELISDYDTLVRLATDVGLDAVKATMTLHTNQYAGEVHHDMEEARKLGIHAVPYFVFDRNYAVVGAQDQEVFRETLQKALEDFKNEQE